MAQAQPPAAAIGDLSGQLIGGRYRLGEQLGQGGMGVVYAAVQESLARPVALKVLQPVLAQNADSLLRFKAEAERAGRLAHPHIVQILDFGHEPSTSAWIAMELLRGESLGARIDRGGISEAEVVRIAKETLSALEAAHGANLVHRDLKPDNIFLADVPGIGTSVKVLDFGIAKVIQGDRKIDQLETQAGTVFGTPRYMSPEQAQGKKLDLRSDLYAVGVLLYQMLVGHAPFIDEDAVVVMAKHIKEKPQSLRSAAPGRPIPSSLDRAVLKSLEKDATGRFASSDEFVKRLDLVLPDVDEATRLARAGKNLRGPIGGAPRGVLIGAAAGLGVAVLVAISLVVASGSGGEPEVVAFTVDPPSTPSGLGGVGSPPNVPSTPRPSPAVALRSEPPGAEVWRDGQLLGVTPLDVSIAAGENAVRVQLRKSGFIETVALLVPGGPSPLVSLAAERPQSAALRVVRPRGGGAHPRGGGAAGGGGDVGAQDTPTPPAGGTGTTVTPPVRPRDPYERFD